MIIESLSNIPEDAPAGSRQRTEQHARSVPLPLYGTLIWGTLILPT